MNNPINELRRRLFINHKRRQAARVSGKNWLSTMMRNSKACSDLPKVLSK